MNTTASGVRPRNRGFTLLELMTVLAVLGVIMAFAAPNFREYKRNAALTNTANLLVSSVYRTRSEAMKEGVPAIMMPMDADGKDTGWKGWVIFMDRNLNDTYDSTVDEIVFVQPGDEIPPQAELDIANSGVGGFVKFGGAGFPKPKAQTASGSSGGSATTGFGGATLTVMRCEEGRKNNPRYTRRVIISPSGRVKSCRPDVDGAANCPAPAGGSEGSLCSSS